MNCIKVLSIMLLKSLSDSILYFDALTRSPMEIGIEEAPSQQLEYSWDVAVVVMSGMFSIFIFIATTGLYLNKSRSQFREDYQNMEQEAGGQKPMGFKLVLFLAGLAKATSKTLSLSTYIAALAQQERLSCQMGLFTLFFFPVVTGEVSLFFRQSQSEGSWLSSRPLMTGIAWTYALSCATLYWRSAIEFPERLGFSSDDMLEDKGAVIYVLFNTLFAWFFLFKQKELSLNSLDSQVVAGSQQTYCLFAFFAPIYKGLVSTFSLIAFLYGILEDAEISRQALVTCLMVLMAVIFIPKMMIEHLLFNQLNTESISEVPNLSIQSNHSKV